MASYYAVATGNWSAATTWASTSGGAAGAGVPTNADDVFMDATSGVITVTVDTATCVCRSLDCNGFTGTFKINSGVPILTIGSSTARADLIMLRFVNTQSFAGPSGGTGIQFSSSAAGTHLIYSAAGKSLSGIVYTFAGSATYQLQDALNNFTFAHASGGSTVDTNGQAVTTGLINITTTTGHLKLGASVIHSSGVASMPAAAAAWTVDAGTSSITFTQAVVFPLAGRTWYDFTFQGTGMGSQVGFNGGGTVHSVTVNTTTSSSGLFVFNSGGPSPSTFNITGTLSLTGSASNRIFVLNYTTITNGPGYSNQVAPVQVNAAAVSLVYVDFMDISAGGAAAPWTGTRLGNAGNNSGITFSAPTTYYFRAGQNQWTAAAAWSLTSGGASAGAYPLAQDTAIFDNNSAPVSGNISLGLGVPVLPTIDASGWTKPTQTLTMGTTSNNIFLAGNLTLGPQIIWGASGTDYVVGRGGRTLSANGGYPSSATWIIVTDAAGYSLTTDWTYAGAAGTFQLSAGGFNTNDHAMRVSSLQVFDAFLAGTSTITITGTQFTVGSNAVAPWDFSTATITFTNTASTITTPAGPGTNANKFGALIFPAGVNQLTLGGSGTNVSTGSITIPAGAAARTVVFGTGTFTVRNGAAGWNVAGAAGAQMTLKPSTGLAWNLSVPSGNVSSDYLNLIGSRAAGGAAFYAGANSTNGGNNTGWQFVAAPVTISRTFALTQAQNLNTQNAITRMAQQAQAAAVNAGQSTSRTFSATQGQGLSSQRAITAYVGAGQAVNVMLGALGTRRTFWAWQGQYAAVTGQPASVLSVQAPAAVASVNIVSNNRHVDRTWTVTQPQVVAVAALQRKRRTVSVTQPQALVALGRTVDSITFALGQASVVVIGFGARFFACTQRQTPTVQREVRATLWVGQDQHVKVHLPTHRGHINVAGSVGKIGVVTTPDAGVAVTTRAGRLTVTEAV